MKNTAAIALLVARAAAQDRADMDQDRNKKDDTQRFRAATQEDTCKDDAVSKADGELKTALANHETQRKLVEGDGTGAATTAGRGTAGEILAKLTDQNTQTKALAAADVKNKVKVEEDIKLDRLELEARRAWDAKKADELAKKVLDDAQQLKVTATTKAHDDAKVIFDGATKAKADAAAHVTDEEAIVTTTLATMNAAMVTWKLTGVKDSVTGEDAGRTDAQILAAIATATTTPAAKLVIARTALNDAVGKCVPSTGTAWTNAACGNVAAVDGTSLATGLVKQALRKQLGVDSLATAIASRETYLDAYCTAAQQLGATDADIKAGKAYWSKANPGVRLDFKFAATPTNLTSDDKAGAGVNAAATASYLATWTFETLGAPIEAIAINGSEASGVALAAMTNVEANKALWHVMKCSATAVAAVAADVGTGILAKEAVTGKALRVYDNASALTFRKTAWPTNVASAVGGLADVITTAKTAKELATSTTVGLEGTFKAWKTAAKAAMDAYDLMITTDAAYAPVGTWKCQDTTIKAASGSDPIGVSTNVDYASCIEAAVATGIDSSGSGDNSSKKDGSSKAARPSNLLTALEYEVTAGNKLWTTSNHLAQAKLECQKLPSMGLYVVAEASAWKPVLPKEVCQGISYLTAVTNAPTLATFKTNLQFVSKAAYDSTGTNYITIAAPDLSAAVLATDGTSPAAAYRGLTGVHTCIKRKNTKGVIWRTTTAKDATNFPANAEAVTNLAAASNTNDATASLNSSTTMTKAYFEGAQFTGGAYLPVNAETTLANGNTPTYKLFKAQMDAWVLLRVNVHTKYAEYLVLKEVVTATGQLFRTEIQTVKRLNARLTGTTTGSGATNTNGNLTDLYATQWAIVYGTVQSEIPALVPDMQPTGVDATAKAANLLLTYKHMLPKSNSLATQRPTGKYSEWLAAVKADADADKAHKDAKALWETATKAVVDQKAVKDKATTELAAIDKIYGAAGVTGKTGQAKKVEDDKKIDTKKAFDDAVIETGTYSGKFDTAKKNSSDAAALQLTKDAYTAIKTARKLAEDAVKATTAALKADKDARAVLKQKLDDKVLKDVAVAKALTTCKNTKYDNYKATLKAAVSNRDKNLKLIKELLEKKDKAAVAAGATGARCNKGLSQGNGRARAAKPCTVETDCCGAAKGPVLAATATGYWKDAPVMTIETCQPATQKTYKYAPPRAPMATTDPADAANAASQQDWPFVCIGGASKLAAAASALATAAYMMA